MSKKALIQRALDQGQGILRLAPNWVPRFLFIPGRRLKLHPDDYYALGADRGGIDERWLTSTTAADNGPKTAPNEGLSFIVVQDGPRTGTVTFRDAVNELKGDLLGERFWKRYQSWPTFAKFFDNRDPLPHHVHHRDKHAALVGQLGKPESYYYPQQLNNHGGTFPYTFFGLRPGTTKDQVRQCLLNFNTGDNKITNLSRAYRLETGTGWNVPPGVLHAPGSLCTYEPQKASDISAMYQSLAGEHVIPEEMLWQHVPASKAGNIDFLLEVLDWEKNTDPDFTTHYFMRPLPASPVKAMQAEGYLEHWISYKSSEFSAKELTVLPQRTVTIRDRGAYGLVLLQGHGRLGSWDVETPALIRFGQLTQDEFFVSEPAARKGVTIVNPSTSDPLVMLKNFGPGNADLKSIPRP